MPASGGPRRPHLSSGLVLGKLLLSSKQFRSILVLDPSSVPSRPRGRFPIVPPLLAFYGRWQRDRTATRPHPSGHASAVCKFPDLGKPDRGGRTCRFPSGRKRSKPGHSVTLKFFRLAHCATSGNGSSQHLESPGRTASHSVPCDPSNSKPAVT